MQLNCRDFYCYGKEYVVSYDMDVLQSSVAN